MEGLEIYNSDGSVNVSITSRLARILLVFSTGSASGSVSVPGLSTGTPFIIATPTSETTGANFFFSLIAPTFTFNASTNTVSWTFGTGAQPARVTVGVF